MEEVNAKKVMILLRQSTMSQVKMDLTHEILSLVVRPLYARLDTRLKVSGGSGKWGWFA